MLKTQCQKSGCGSDKILGHAAKAISSLWVPSHQRRTAFCWRTGRQRGFEAVSTLQEIVGVVFET
jgi:hypothetical protein